MSDVPEVRFERMRPHEVRECRQRADVAFLPLGSLEWHGLHNPLGTDGLKVHHVCCVAARLLGGGAVFPPLCHGLPRDSFDTTLSPQLIERVARALGTEAQRVRGFGPHGGMDIQEQWLFYQRLLRMTLERMAGFGFRSIYICSGHNPLVHWARPVAIAFARATRMAGQPVSVDWGGEGDAAGLNGDHGGRWETSHMMAAVPGCVDLTELERNPEYKGVGSGADAVESTREQGEAWVQTCAAAIATEARWLIDHYPDLPPRHRHTR